MINLVKRAIQSYYPDKYIFLEFLRTGGWQEVYHTPVYSRWELRIDGLVFEVDHQLQTDHTETPLRESVFIRALRPSHRNPKLRVTGAGLRLWDYDPVAIDDFMLRTYHAPGMRGTQYNALI